VDTGFVGRGKRMLSLSSEVSGSAGVTVSGVTPSASHTSVNKTLDTTQWDDDQAYGFDTRNVSTEQPLELNVDVPSVVQDGEAVQIKIDSNRKAYLVVYYLESDGKAELLWPSNEEPNPVAEPGRPAQLPSPRELAAGFKIQAALRSPNTPCREALVVYGFADKREFDQLKPAAGSSDSNGSAYAAQLTRRIGDIPISRWSRSIASYRIDPKPR
jgi:hypothetical protein